MGKTTIEWCGWGGSPQKAGIFELRGGCWMGKSGVRGQSSNLPLTPP